MKAKELKLIVTLLGKYEDDLGNRGCNDVPDSFWNGWSEEERRQFVREYHIENGEEKEAEEGHLHLPDYCIVSALTSKLLKHIKEIEKA